MMINLKFNNAFALFIENYKNTAKGSWFIGWNKDIHYDTICLLLDAWKLTIDAGLEDNKISCLLSSLSITSDLYLSSDPQFKFLVAELISDAPQYNISLPLFFHQHSDNLAVNQSLPVDLNLISELTEAGLNLQKIFNEQITGAAKLLTEALDKKETLEQENIALKKEIGQLTPFIKRTDTNNSQLTQSLVPELNLITELTKAGQLLQKSFNEQMTASEQVLMTTTHEKAMLIKKNILLEKEITRLTGLPPINQSIPEKIIIDNTTLPNIPPPPPPPPPPNPIPAPHTMQPINMKPRTNIGSTINDHAFFLTASTLENYKFKNKGVITNKNRTDNSSPEAKLLKERLNKIYNAINNS